MWLAPLCPALTDKNNFFWEYLYLFWVEGKTRLRRIFIKFQDMPTNNHIKGQGSAKAFY